MLKISETTAPAKGAILRLEGQIAGQWVDELRRAYGDALRHAEGPLTFDLENVTFIDGAGVDFLSEIYAEISCVNCSLFAAEQLKRVEERHQAVRR